MICYICGRKQLLCFTTYVVMKFMGYIINSYDDCDILYQWFIMAAMFHYICGHEIYEQLYQ